MYANTPTCIPTFLAPTRTRHVFAFLPTSLLTSHTHLSIYRSTYPTTRLAHLPTYLSKYLPACLPAYLPACSHVCSYVYVCWFVVDETIAQKLLGRIVFRRNQAKQLSKCVLAPPDGTRTHASRQTCFGQCGGHQVTIIDRSLLLVGNDNSLMIMRIIIIIDNDMNHYHCCYYYQCSLGAQHLFLSSQVMAMHYCY